jgi:glycosyltransferase involved in cell wall biosynthesis
VRPRQGQADLPNSQPGIEELLTPGVPLPLYQQLRMGFTWPGTLVQRWRRWRPDLVHVATEGPLCWSAVQAARRLGLPVSSDLRTNFHAYSRHYGMGWLHGPVLAYLRGFHRRTRCTMVPTEALRRELAAQGFEDLRVVARGVDTQLYAPERRSEALRATWGAAPDDLVLVCVGRLAAEKNLTVLIAAYEQLRQHDPRARLLLVGDGPLRTALQARCPQAIFAGQRSGSDLAAHYASADLFAFPSLTETFGNVTPEAMASGLPVVAYDYAAAGQLLRQGESGLLVPPGDAGAFIDAVTALAADPARRRALGAQARATAITLGWDDVVARFEALLLQLITTPAQPGPAPHAATVHTGV